VFTNTIQETDKRNGKEVAITRFTVSEEGQTMTITVEEPVSGGKRQFVAHKE